MSILRCGINRCAAFKCTNNSNNCDFSFFRFPKDVDRARIWVTACGREDLLYRLGNLHTSSRLCAVHFEDEMFANRAHNRLHRKAVPRLFPALEGGSSQAGSPAKPTALNTSDEEENNSPAIIVKKEEPTEFLGSLGEGPTDPTALEASAQDYKTDIKTSRRYSDAFKDFCLELYFNGPRLYKKNCVKQFCLPSVATLHKFIGRIGIKPGMNELVFETIKKKVDNFSDEDKLCMLCVDEISIKAHLFYGTDTDKIIGFEDLGDGSRNFKPALTATIIMIRGLKTNWKQPIAYYFVNSTCRGTKLKYILLHIISKLNQINLKVLGVVSDMAPNNMQLAKLLNVSPEKPYFFNEEQRIVFCYNTPHLLLSLRDNLLKHRFVVNNNIVSWEFIRKFYEHDKDYPSRAAPKLTSSHISPNEYEKTKLKYASQIFSNTVAAALNLYIRFNALPPEAKSTQEFIQLINNLFDILNSSLTVGTTKYQEAYRGTDDQNKFLNKCYDFFDNLKILNWKDEDITETINCVDGWKITICGILHLWDILTSHGMQFLLTRRVNQDCLKNFFCSLGRQSGSCINPTPIQFNRVFRWRFCLDMIHSGSENCEKDQDEILLKMADMPTDQFEDKTDVLSSEKLTDVDYRTSNILRTNFTKSICGYLIRKCLVKHTCEICEAYAEDCNELDETSLLNLFCYVKAYDRIEKNLFGSLYMRNTDFVDFVTYMEVLFQQNFEAFAPHPQIVQKLITLFKKIPFVHPCQNFPQEYVVKLYARIKIFYTLKYINRNFKSPDNKRKLIIWKPKLN